MAKIEFVGIDEYFAKLNQIGEKSKGLCKRALYDGAGVLADAVRAEVQALPTTDINGNPQQTLVYEKDGLLEGLGITQMKDDGGIIRTRVDFDGYNRLRSKTYPSGHPNSMIARAINSGTSKRPKNPFMARAVKKARAKAEAAMSSRMEEDISKIMK
jgi:HK97 gp10 family phage protein